jgi:hypothetical protein
MSALQCPKRLHLEVHHKDLAEISAATQAAFDTGHLVGDIARQLYGQGQGVLIEYGPGLKQALRDTQMLMARGPQQPIFEATYQYQGVLVRVDALLPAAEGWRIVEVKSSTSLKDEHIKDSAIQAWVFQNLGYRLDGIALAYVDNQFVYPGNGDFSGLLIEQDISEPVSLLAPQVPGWIRLAQEAAGQIMPEVAVGEQCTKPYACPFFHHCWPSQAQYPVYGLGGSKKKLAELVIDGYRDIRDVPAERISGAGHKRIHRITLSGEPELLPGAAQFVKALPYPRYYLDFETTGPAVPAWPGTRPYETLPFQYSCHIEEAPGQLRHAEFLDLSGDPPMRPLAEHMIETLGTEGPVLMYTSYERGVIRGLADRYKDLAPQLKAILKRLVDLHPPTQKNFYHPSMLGSWSIKAVLPAVAPDMDYAQLEGIKEGMGAADGYLEAIHPDTSPARKAELEEQLLRYCKFDTEAMVRLVRYFENGQ